MKPRLFAHAALLSALATISAASAEPFYYVDWTAANAGAGTASGVIDVPGSAPVAVTFAATYPNGAPGNFAFAQTSGGNNYWNPSSPYISASVSNAPPDSDIVALQGGQNQIYTLTLSEPIKDPIMAIVSLGRPGSNTIYAFDSPFTIVSQDVGSWGGSASALEELPGNVLMGNEGHGTIRFDGIFSTFSWQVPTPEYWHGFTFGIRTTEALEPDVPLPEPAALGGLALLGIIGLKRPRRMSGQE